MTFRIFDDNYSDNQGGLTATIFSVPTYSISGRVLDENANYIENVTISTNSSFNTTTDNNGIYTFGELPAQVYTITPSKSGFSFSPASPSITIPPNAAGQDFIATPTVCPVEAALGQTGSSTSFEALDASDLIILYTRLRDEVLLGSGTGQKYVEDYDNYGAELSVILLTDSDLRSQTGQFLEHAAPAFGSLLPDSTEEIPLSQALYDEAEILVHDLANAGSTAFHDKVLQTWANMGLDEYIGENATEIWEEMQTNTIYLPIVLK